MPAAPPDPGTVVAVLLAAGGGRRFDGAQHKLLTEVAGRPLYRYALDSVLGSGIGDVVVVTGAVALDLPAGVTHVHNSRWADGQAGSIRAGVQAAEALGAGFVVIGLADQPMIPSSAWRAVAGAPDEADHPIVVATYGGRRGNPVRLAARIWQALPASGDEGARVLMRMRPDWVRGVPCDGSSEDIDTLEDLHRWKRS